MIGIVSGRYALLPVPIRVPHRGEVAIEFVIDTGFSGYLTLPPDAVAVLGLPFEQSIPARLADGASVMMPTYTAVVVWDGVERVVEVLATGRQPLLGTALLDANDVHMEFKDGGQVEVTPLIDPI
jgi:clan AA aspartic protease